VLEQLAARATLAVLTNKPASPTRQILAGLGLARYFDPSRVMGGDGPAPRKPDPSGLLRLMADAGVGRGDVILVGDSLVDWRTARAADVAVCLAKYGFGFEGFPPGHVAPSDYLVETPGELLHVL
jgi:phosphoglycolate phosphatase